MNQPPSAGDNAAKKQLFESVKSSMESMRGAFQQQSQRQIADKSAERQIQVEQKNTLQSISSSIKEQFAFIQAEVARRRRAEQRISATERDDTSDQKAKVLDRADRVDDKEEETKGFFSGLLSGISGLLGAAGLTGLLSAIKTQIGTLLKAAPIVSLVAGLVWTIVEGIKGFFKAEEWGVSKVSAVIGSVLGGAGEGGLKDAFKNAGRWALIGAGIGMVGGPPGIIAGGLIGAALGGLLGFIGGKNIAQAIDSVVESISNIFNAFIESDYFAFIKDAFMSTVNLIISPFMGLFDAIMETVNNIIEIWSDDESSILERIGATVGELFFAPFRWMIGWIRGLVEGVVEWFEDWFTGEEALIIRMFETEPFQWIFDQIKNLWQQLMRPIDNVAEAISDTITNIQRAWGREDQSIFERIINVIGEFFSGVRDAVIGWFEGLYEGVINFVAGLFGFDDIFDDDEKSDGLIDIIWNFITEDLPDFFRGLFDSALDAWDDFTDLAKEIRDMIIDPVMDFFGNIVDAIPSWDDITGAVREMWDDSWLGSTVGAIGDVLDHDEEAVRKADEAVEASGRGGRRQGDPRSSALDDGIVTNTGNIIQLNPNDNIIATQNEPMVGSALNQLSESRDTQQRMQQGQTTQAPTVNSSNVNNNSSVFIGKGNEKDATLDRIFATER